MDITERQGKTNLADTSLQIVHVKGSNFLALSFVLPPYDNTCMVFNNKIRKMQTISRFA